MKDTRVAFFRKTLEGVIDSLEATVRLRGWSADEAVPEPLKESASQLVTYLGTIDRLVSSSFTGAPADVARVSHMVAAMRRLDAAYVAYRREVGRPGENDRASDAASALDAEIHVVKGDRRWQA
jgi:hypothetical protein